MDYKIPKSLPGYVETTDGRFVPYEKARLGNKAEVARELAYRLYTIAERKKRAAEALSYNGLVQSWPEIIRLAREAPLPGAAQAEMFG